MNRNVVLAFGGNAILPAQEKATYENQYRNIQASCGVIVNILEGGDQVTITHGNGPQVGNILKQQEEAKTAVPPMPLHVCSAKSQGFIGYMLDQALRNELCRRGRSEKVVSLLTQTVIDRKDPAFFTPTKPIGRFYSESEAKELEAEKGWAMVEDSGRGWRRVVPSPEPQSILGADTIGTLAKVGTIVVASGGGGIPVVKNEQGVLIGMEAVIDKDRSALKLALETEADVLMIVTDVENVYIDYGKPTQRALTAISVLEAKQHVADGQFAAGSMGPKMEAAISFAELGGESIICSLQDAAKALNGEAGTRISKHKQEFSVPSLQQKEPSNC
ncbi:carbamate kinase [Shouchella shacheensis]|uniref:carbamate kinase n=1 Tax=Shouchella shacheensis TaxID=1649580 RepID=UPI00073FFD54|nr:carbamate kinase [Shouchella shacheensis]